MNDFLACDLLFQLRLASIDAYMRQKRASDISSKITTFQKAIPVLSWLNSIFAGIFYVIWIVIGLFILAIITQGIRRGDFTALLASNRPVPVQGKQSPTETTIPDVGKVNIACVQEVLSPESIQKLVSGGDASFLVGEEKTKFEACVLEPESSPKTQE